MIAENFLCNLSVLRRIMSEKKGGDLGDILKLLNQDFLKKNYCFLLQIYIVVGYLEHLLEVLCPVCCWWGYSCRSDPS